MRHRIIQALGAAAAGVAMVVGVLAPPSTAAAPAAGGYQAQSPEYGMSVFIYGNPSTTARDLKKLQGVNFGWQKSLFRWRDLEGDCKGCFAWDESDRVVRESSKAGLKIIGRLDFQPTWARADGANNGAPDNYQDFADFVKTFVSRYKTGSQYGTVQAIEIWNEVNLQREWGSAISPQSAAEYVRMLSMAYRAAKQADPNITVITAGLSPTGWSDATAQPDDQYLQWMYAAGLKGGVNYDVFGANGNVQCPSVEAAPGQCPVMADRMQHGSFYFRRIEQLHDIMVANGDTTQQVWLMEFGWTTDTVNAAYSWYATTDTTKSELIVKAFQYASRSWAPWIGVMTLWTLADPNWSAQDEQVYWAVTNPDGTTRLAYDRLIAAGKNGELPNLTRAGNIVATDPATIPAEPSTPPALTTSAAPSSAAPAAATTEAQPTTAAVQPATTFSPGGGAAEVMRVIDTDVNLRSTPSRTGAVVSTLTYGDVVIAIGGSQQADGITWRNIRDAAGREGWVANQYLQVV